MTYNKETTIEVLNFIKAGHTRAEASRKFHITFSAIAFWCRKAGISNKTHKQYYRVYEGDECFENKSYYGTRKR
jgi:hypothetical protein